MATAFRRPVVAHAGRLVLEALALVLAAVAVAAVLLTWRLSHRPMDIAALVPFLEQELSERHPSFDVRIGGAALEWAGWRRLVAVRLRDVRAVDGKDEVIARLPALSLALHPLALLEGEIAPVEITLHEPGLRLLRDADGFDLRLDADRPVEAAPGADLLPRVLAWLMTEPSDDEPMSRLERLVVRHAHLVVEDARLGVQWAVPASDMTIERAAGGLRGDLAADLVTDRDRADLAAFGAYDRTRKRADVAIAFGALRPAAFAALAGGLPGLDGLDVPISGTLTVDVDAGGTIHHLGFDVSAGSGRFDPRLLTVAGLDGSLLPARPIRIAAVALRGHLEPALGTWRIDAFRLDLPLDDGIPLPGLPEPVRLSSVEGRGHLDTARGELAWEDVSIDLGTDGEVRLPAPVGLRLPLHRIHTTGRWAIATGRIDIETLDLALAGPRATIAGTVRLDGATAEIAATARIDAVATDDLPRYWPERAAPGGRAWVESHLRGGEARALEATVAARLIDGDVIVDALSGRFTVAGVDLDYLPPMPVLPGVSAAASFDRTSLSFAVAPVSGSGVTMEGASVVLRGLGTPTEQVDIDLTTSGAVADHLRLIDHAPLHYARAVGIDPAGTSGDARVRLRLSIPLRAELPLADVAVAAEARLDNLGLAGIVPGYDLSGGNVDLSLDGTGMRFEGGARVGAVAGRIEGRQAFERGRNPSDIVREIVVSVPDADLADVQALVFAATPVPLDLLNGSIDAEIRLATLTSGQGAVDARLDLTDAFVGLPVLGWTKPRGAPAFGTVTADLDGGQLRGGPRFSLTADGLDVAGGAGVDRSGRLERVEFGRIQIGRTDGTGSIVATGDGRWSVAVTGRNLDLRPLLVQRDADAPAEGTASPLPDGLIVTVDLESVALGEGRTLQRVAGRIERRGGRWASVDLTGTVDVDKRVAFRVGPGDDGRRQVFASADDAGAALRALGIFDDMQGGRLTLTGTVLDDRPNRPLTGRLLITDYHVRRAPALAQVLAMLALTEIDNALRGDGLSFDVLDAPFTLDGRYLSIDAARASGLSLGVTATGTVDIAGRALDLRGTVVPVYALNSALGNIPLIGFLFSGGERGGGLFAPTYTLSGPVDDPRVLVNPVAALTPGVLRGVFDVFDGKRTLPDVGISDDGGN